MNCNTDLGLQISDLDVKLICMTAEIWGSLLQGEIPEGKLPYYNLPVFNYHKGYLSTSYNATYYELAQRHPEVPRLSALQEGAIQHFNALARVRHRFRSNAMWEGLRLLYCLRYKGCTLRS